jgi:hypothetical protein
LRDILDGHLYDDREIVAFKFARILIVQLDLLILSHQLRKVGVGKRPRFRTGTLDPKKFRKKIRKNLRVQNFAGLVVQADLS